MASFTRDDTAWAKGVAILAMVFHHVCPSDCTTPIVLQDNIDYMSIIAATCKVCVPLFTILSGYGLAKGYRPDRRIKFYDARYVCAHLVQLYAMYWVVLAWAYVAIWLRGGSVLSFYGEGRGAVLNLVSDVFGMALITNGPRLVGTWYITAIVIYYILTPLLIRLVRKFGLVAVLALWTPWVYWRIFGYDTVDTDDTIYYVHAFALGIYFAQTGILQRWKSSQLLSAKLCSIGLLALAVIVRMFAALMADTLVAVAVLRVCTCFADSGARFNDVLRFFGRHSANLWLIHAFLMFRMDLDARSVIAKYVIFLFACTCYSLGIEAAKDFLGFKTAVAAVRRRIMGSSAA